MKSKENEILVGQKPFINYIRSMEVLLKKKNLNQIVIRARGKNISKAVDLSEAGKNKFFEDLGLEISSVKTGTVKFKKQDAERGEIELSVSTIELVLKRR